MVKIKKQKHKPHDKDTPALGVAWYRRDQWERLLEISVDRDILEETYEEWKIYAKSKLRNLERSGIVLKKVDVDVDELLQWCKTQKKPVDGEARSLFAAKKLREIDKRRK